MRILLGGVPFGCDNIGDEAIIAGVVKMLKESIPGVELTVATDDPATAALLGVGVVPPFGFRDTGFAGFAAEAKRHDAYVWCGATGLSDYPNVALDLLEKAQCEGVPTFVWGVGMDDELNPVFFRAHGKRRLALNMLGLVSVYEGWLRGRLKRRIARVLPRCRGVWVRDPQSAEMLAATGFPAAAVTADTAILLADRVELGSDRVVLGSNRVGLGSDRVEIGSDRVEIGSDRVGLGSDRVSLGSDRVSLGSDRVSLGSDKVVLGSDRVSLGSDRVRLGSDRVDSTNSTLIDPTKTLKDSTLTLTDPKRPYPTLGLCISTQRQVADLDGLRRLIAAVRDSGARVLGIPMNPKTDRALLESLGVECIAGKTPEAVMSAASECSVVLSSRLHLLILAANAGTPGLGIARGSKLANWLSNFGQTVEGSVFDCDWEKVAEHVLSALKDRGDWDKVRDAAYAALLSRFEKARAEFVAKLEACGHV